MRKSRVINFLLPFILALSLSGTSSGQKKAAALPIILAAAPKQGLSPDAQRRQDAFMSTWLTVNDNYFDKTFSGLDWNKIREEYQPRVTAAKSDAEVHRILSEMVNRLGKSHFAIIPPEYLKTLRQVRREAKAREKVLSGEKPTSEAAGADDDDDLLIDDPDATYGVGVELKLLDNKFVISRMDKLSSAAIAGLKPGFVIDKINGVSLTDLVQRIELNFPAAQNTHRHLPLQIVNGLLNGEQGTTVFLTCLDENDQPHDYKVPRLPLTGDSVSIGMRLPMQFLQYLSVPIGEDIGYVKFNMFAIPVIGKFCDSLTDFAGKKGLIIDLRGNMGGVLGTIVGLTGMMSDHQTAIGTSRYRTGSELLMAQPKKKRFSGPLVFLVDNESVSAAEIFAASMQDNHRAVIVGDHTAGEALPSVTTTLATGAVLIYPIANFITPGGRSIEGTGVEPDFPITLDRKSLLKGVDTQLEKAVSIIETGEQLPKHAENGLKKEYSVLVPIPPPPPARVTKGAGRGKPLPPPPVSAPPPSVKDPAALKVFADFIDKIGSADEFQKVGSYTVSGRGSISFRGVQTDVAINAWRQAPDKFTLVMTSAAVGETREVYTGAGLHLQTDFGVDSDLRSGVDSSQAQLFSALFNVADPKYFTSLTFEGSFDVGGRKTNVVTGRTRMGLTVGFGFDAETKLLTRYTPPGAAYTYGDYRIVGKVMLPFQVGIDRLLQIQLDTVELNTEIDPANFERKERCFDK